MKRRLGHGGISKGVAILEEMAQSSRTGESMFSEMLGTIHLSTMWHESTDERVRGSCMRQSPSIKKKKKSGQRNILKRVTFYNASDYLILSN
jgi:hypothetical protein